MLRELRFSQHRRDLVADFPIIPAKTALLFFDCLNIYLRPEDPAARAAVEASGQIPALQKINQASRAAGIPVFYAQADHRPDYRDFAPHIVDLGYDGRPGEAPRRTSPPPVVGSSHGAEVIDEIAPQPGDYVIKKHRWSTFFQTHFELSLRTAGVDTVMLAGGAIEVGIASTAYSGRDLDFNQIILEDACSSSRPAVRAAFMNEIFPIFARVMTVDEAIGLIQR
jgi:nicotinamidase-related amidase